jgi:hypothetical protein
MSVTANDLAPPLQDEAYWFSEIDLHFLYKPRGGKGQGEGVLFAVVDYFSAGRFFRKHVGCRATFVLRN